MVLLPSWAEAQLFPNRTVTRERQPCASEPPFYSQVRQNYFGYYPTCWNRFPAGWGCPCPNPELPNAAAAFAKQPRDPLPEGVPDTGLDGMGDDMGPLPDTRPGEAESMPPVPGAGRSPFQSDPSAPDPGTGRAPRGGEQPPRGTDLPPQTSRTPAQRSGAKPAVNTSTPPVPAPTTGLLEMPRVLPPVTAAPATQPTLDPGMVAMAPDATLASASNPDRPDLGSLPAALTPDGSMPRDPAMGIDPALLAQNQPMTGAVPAQAPQRRGLLSGLFGSSKRRR